MNQVAGRIPVIIGVGQVNDRTGDHTAAPDSLGLMEAALRCADAFARSCCIRKHLRPHGPVLPLFDSQPTTPLPLDIRHLLGALPNRASPFADWAKCLDWSALTS